MLPARSYGVLPAAVGRWDPGHGFQVLPVQAVERNLIGGAVGSCTHSIAPSAELPVHIIKRGKRTSQQEVPFYISDGILDLPLVCEQ